MTRRWDGSNKRQESWVRTSSPENDTLVNKGITAWIDGRAKARDVWTDIRELVAPFPEDGRAETLKRSHDRLTYINLWILSQCFQTTRRSDFSSETRRQVVSIIAKSIEEHRFGERFTSQVTSEISGTFANVRNEFLSADQLEDAEKVLNLYQNEIDDKISVVRIFTSLGETSPKKLKALVHYLIDSLVLGSACRWLVNYYKHEKKPLSVDDRREALRYLQKAVMDVQYLTSAQERNR